MKSICLYKEGGLVDYNDHRVIIVINTGVDYSTSYMIIGNI